VLRDCAQLIKGRQAQGRCLGSRRQVAAMAAIPLCLCHFDSLHTCRNTCSSGTHQLHPPAAPTYQLHISIVHGSARQVKCLQPLPAGQQPANAPQQLAASKAAQGAAG
jgi:hypothetical protein